MNIVYDKEIIIFRKDGQYGAMYSLGLSKKTQDDKTEYGYMPCKFRKGVDVADKTKIKIKNAWLSFNLKDKKTVPYIFINSFEELGELPKVEEKPKEDPYKDFQEEHIEEIMELPF